MAIRRAIHTEMPPRHRSRSTQVRSGAHPCPASGFLGSPGALSRPNSVPRRNPGSLNATDCGHVGAFRLTFSTVSGPPNPPHFTSSDRLQVSVGSSGGRLRFHPRCRALPNLLAQPLAGPEELPGTGVSSVLDLDGDRCSPWCTSIVAKYDSEVGGRRLGIGSRYRHRSRRVSTRAGDFEGPGALRRNEPGKPTIEGGVDVRCGVAVLGAVASGANSIIGVNTVLVRDVPESSVVRGGW